MLFKWPLFVKAFGWFSTVLSLVSAILNLYCYTYPSLDPQNCSWVVPDDVASSTAGRWSALSRLLAGIPYFGDLYANSAGRASRHTDDIRMLAIGDPQIDGAWPSTGRRKRLDIYGNDHYLGHIYGVMKRRLQPSHVAVLGDLISCNWVSDSEYFNRTYRYATRLFRRPETPFPGTPGAIDLLQRRGVAENGSQYAAWLKNGVETREFEQAGQYAFQNVYNWDGAAGEPLFVNTTGNHDVGYAGEISYNNMYRYSRFYGQPNYWVEYNTHGGHESHESHPWRLVVVNSLLLDGPAKHTPLYEAQWQFLRALAAHPFNGSTVLITHVPLHKPEGFCADPPATEYFTRQNCPAWDWDKLGNLRSQTLLSPDTSQKLLDAAFANGRPGIILTGHDHEGCITYFARQGTGAAPWSASAQKPVNYTAVVKEITVRSIMGEYGGNTGLLTGHFSTLDDEWQFHYTLCPFAIQHVWWASKVTLLLAVFFQTVAYFL